MRIPATGRGRASVNVIWGSTPVTCAVLPSQRARETWDGVIGNDVSRKAGESRSLLNGPTLALRNLGINRAISSWFGWRYGVYLRTIW